jgi:hypothetical protein
MKSIKRHIRRFVLEEETKNGGTVYSPPRVREKYKKCLKIFKIP